MTGEENTMGNGAEQGGLYVGANVRVGTLGATGVITGFDDGSRPGVSVRLHAPVKGLLTCYATYAECSPVERQSRGVAR